MARQISGNLKDGLDVGENGVLTFTAISSDSGSELVAGSVVTEDVSSGAYDITLINGSYSVQWNDTDLNTTRDLGNISVTTGAASTLLSLLGAGLSVSDAQLLTDLDDVSISAATDNEVLRYDTTSGGWQNEALGALADKDTASTVDIDDSAVTLAKLANQADETVLANISGSAAPPSAAPAEAFVRNRQAYTEFIYNTSLGSNSGNAYNNFADLYAELQNTSGLRRVTIQQNEEIPYDAGTNPYNFDGVEFAGNGVAFGNGGLQLEIQDGVTISSWDNMVLSAGIGLASVSNSHVMTISSGSPLFTVSEGSGMLCFYEAFFNITGGSIILVLNDGSLLYADSVSGNEVVDIGASGQCTLVMRGTGTSLDVNSIKGSGVFFRIGGDVAFEPAGLFSSQANFSGTAGTNLLTYLSNLGFDESSAAGDLIVGDGGATVKKHDVLNIGSDGSALIADSGEPLGMKWASVVRPDVVTDFTKQVNFTQTSLSDGTNIAWNLDDNQSATVTLGGNRTLDNPTNMKDGGTYQLIVKQDATGSRTLSFGSAYKWSGGTAPTLSTVANAVDILTFKSDGTNMFGIAQLNFS